MVTPARQAGEIRAAFWSCADAAKCISGASNICMPWCGTRRKNNGGKNMKKKLLALMMVFAMLMSVTPMASASVWEEMADEMAATEVRNSLDKAIELVEAHKDEIYAEAYGYAAAEGYIADAQAWVDSHK